MIPTICWGTSGRDRRIVIGRATKNRVESWLDLYN